MEVMEVVGVEGSRVLVERYRPLHDTVLKTVSCSELFVKWQHVHQSLERLGSVRSHHTQTVGFEVGCPGRRFARIKAATLHIYDVRAA